VVVQAVPAAAQAMVISQEVALATCHHLAAVGPSWSPSAVAVASVMGVLAHTPEAARALRVFLDELTEHGIGAFVDEINDAGIAGRARLELRAGLTLAFERR